MHADSASLTRRPLAVGDAKTSADLLNAMETADQIGENYNEQDTYQELIDPYADLERASLGVFDGDVMVGFMKVRWKQAPEVEHRVWLDGGVHPDYRRRGIGSALVKAGVAAAKTLHALHHPTLKLIVDVHKAEDIVGLPELLRAEGFAPVRYFQRMEQELGDAHGAAVIPDGLALEPWTTANGDDFRVVRNESFRDVWGSTAMSAELWANKIVNQTFRPTVSFLLRDTADATAASMLVVMHWEADTLVSGIREAYFIYLGTLRGYRNRGAATALLRHGLNAAAEQGYDRVIVNVDSENPSGSLGVFEKVGFRPSRREVRWALEA